jgi:three-Cys-motif partner protein
MIRRASSDSLAPDPRPELIVERGPNDNGVGTWVPFEKHRYLYQYLDATRFAWEQFENRVFIDPFAGPGRIQVGGEAGTKEGGAVRAWRALEKDAPFTQMLVGDLVAQRADACASRLRAIGAPATPFVGPAVDTIKTMVSQVSARSLAMAYIDPYNLELLSFSIIEDLAKLKKVDLAINFCTMDLQRNVELEFDPKRARFDDTAPGWRRYPAVLNASRPNVKLEFFKYWCGLVRDLGFRHSKEMPLIRNKAQHPIYRLVFFSRHAFPDRIWNDIARGPTGDLFDEN